MDWTILGIITTAIVSLGSFGLSLYTAKVNKDTTEIDNLRKIIDVQGTELAKVRNKIEELENKDIVKTEAILTAFRCKLYKTKEECPVLSHIESHKVSQQS